MSSSLWSQGLQHARPPYPSSTSRVYSNAYPLSWWCHPTTESSVTPFSSHLQSFPASGSFQMSHFFTSGGQSIGVSALTSVLPVNTGTHLLWDGLVGSPCSPRDSQESSPTPQFKQTSSKSGKKYIKAVYFHPAYLTYMHSIWWEILGWKKHKLESRLQEDISVTSDMQMTPPLWQKVKKN